MTREHSPHAGIGFSDDGEVRLRAYRELERRDAGLARLIVRHGRLDPYSWTALDAAPGGDAFAELALHIVGQQLSTQSALKIYDRLRLAAGGEINPGRVLDLPADELRATGMSGAKASSLRDLAGRVLDGRLSFDRVAHNDDASAQAELEAVRGVGPWTAQMFLLHHLRRPDIFPADDVGLLRGAQSAFDLPERPAASELSLRAEPWRPFRSYAAALLWAHSRSR
jgi:3-methyladenine DNA glycosylase/8-oxoguanine DNA glycosylase